jgi:Na+/H+-dicarboxylate symporter
MFITLLKMMVVPLVFVSLVCGVASLGDIAALGRVGIKTIALYLLTTAVAISIALALATAFAPGVGFDLSSQSISYQAKEAPALGQVLIDMIPANPVMAMAEGQMLQVIVFSLLFGVALTLSGSSGQRILAIFTDLNEVIMKMVFMVIRVAPLGVFCLLAKTFSSEGIDILLPLLGYVATVIVALLCHLLGTFTLLLRFLARINPLVFISKMRTPMAFAFSTSSSGATIPITLSAVETRLGVKNSVASFTIPLGATINMDGTAIMQGVATVFIANVYGIELGIGAFLTVILTATLASIGTAAVPSAGLIMLTMVLAQVGLPVEGIALIFGIDRIIDMLRTAVNVAGDATVTCVVARSEGALDQEIFDDPDAGVLIDP